MNDKATFFTSAVVMRLSCGVPAAFLAVSNFNHAPIPSPMFYKSFHALSLASFRQSTAHVDAVDKSVRMVFICSNS